MKTSEWTRQSSAERVTGWIADDGMALLRIGLGVVFVWFGVLKLLPGVSPAEDLAARTVDVLTLGVMKPHVSLPVLAAWECLIGVGMVTGRLLGWALVLMFAHVAGTLLPLFFFPAETFAVVPHAATTAAQYITTNVVLVTAGVVVGAAVRGGGLAAEPEIARAVR